MPPHLVQPCYVALGQALIWGLYPDWFRALSIGFPLPRLGPAVDHDGATASHVLSSQFIVYELLHRWYHAPSRDRSTSAESRLLSSERSTPKPPRLDDRQTYSVRIFRPKINNQGYNIFSYRFQYLKKAFSM